MVFGYTPLDPLVVICGTLLAVWYLRRNSVKLIGFMPTALSLWFFVPLATNLTLWQTIPLVLAGRVVARGMFVLPRFAISALLFVVFCFAVSSVYALVAGTDGTRALIRIVYYAGVFGVFAFSYEMGRKPETYEVLLKGLVVMGIVYAAYGAYQIIGFYTGLPVRGIIYGATSEAIIATEAGIPRVNSLANEPKRLGYVLFLAAMACVFLARTQPKRRAHLRWAGAGILAISVVTFSGSYFLAVALLGMGVMLLYPTRVAWYGLGALAVAVFIIAAFPQSDLFDSLRHGYDRRMDEVELGLNNEVVYRQEFFAWDYITNNPLTALTGVGVGQYYSVLNANYGDGVGYDESGQLIPLNSNFLELTFDLGAVAAIFIYSALLWLVIRLRKADEAFLSISILFLVVQSFTILTLLYVALFSGVGLAKIASRSKAPRRKQ